MSDHSITSLIEKLEGAEVGSRELDCEIAQALGWSVHNARRGGLWAVTDGRPYKALTTSDEDMAVLLSIDCWTLSLDAALALAERVLTMGAWDVGYTYNSDRPHYARLVIVRDDEGQPEIYGRAATPALALCAAILHAQSEARV